MVSAGPSRRKSMPKSVAKIVLSGSRDIPFNRLVLSQANVRRIKAGVSIVFRRAIGTPFSG